MRQRSLFAELCFFVGIEDCSGLISPVERFLRVSWVKSGFGG
jgi:hypothetical protein